MKVDIRSEGLKQTINKKQKTKDKKQKCAISENCWLEIIWRRKRKEKKEEVREEVRLYRRKNGWLGRWAKKWVIGALSLTGLRGVTERTLFRWGIIDCERGHMISIISMMKSLMMNLIIWLMIVSDLIVNDIRRWYDYLDDADWCYQLWHETRMYVCDKTSVYLVWIMPTIYTI